MPARPKIVVFVIVAAIVGCALFAVAQNNPANPAKKPDANARAAQPDRPAQARPAAPEAAKRPPAAATKPVADKDREAGKPADETDEKAIRASADAFTRLYNAHDAKGLAALFAMKAEMIDEDGKLVKGREAIEAEFAQQFADEPECTMRVDV